MHDRDSVEIVAIHIRHIAEGLAVLYTFGVLIVLAGILTRAI